MLEEDLRGSLYPWIEIESVYTPSLLRSFLRCRNALDDLLALKISWQDYLEILASEEVDMDEYANTVFYNFKACDFLTN